MFAPSQPEVRRFFCETYRKSRAGAPLTPMESLASDWIGLHPEYHADLQHIDAALAAQFDVSAGRTNPFLHLSMHLSISEQLGIDQPRGIKQAFDLLTAQLGSAHDAQHEVMECLGEMIWHSQRSGAPPDGERYIDCVRRRASATSSRRVPRSIG
ncbi:MAG: DUF1841 family protein [Burkholderiales bacterium]|jgi:hypothetical protein|nr:DUF1841 family protein [Burkholderiales bacterium]